MHQGDSVKGCRHLAKSGHYMQELLRLELWPISKVMSQKTIGMILAQMKQYKYYKFKNREYRNCLGERCDFKKLLETSADKHRDEVLALCLNCVIKGKPTMVEGNCGAKLLEYC